MHKLSFTITIDGIDSIICCYGSIVKHDAIIPCLAYEVYDKDNVIVMTVRKDIVKNIEEITL